MEPAREYLRHRAHIDQALKLVCRRNHLRPEDAEDFCSHFHVKLVENNFSLLTKFEGRSSMLTFLVVVATHSYQDWRNARWGKWRPSAQAKRLGKLAIHLETLTVRDGCTMDHAEELLRASHGPEITRRQLEEMAATFPVRAGRRFVDIEVIEGRPAPGSSADELVIETESAGTAQKALAALRDALSAASDDDRLLVKLHFQQGLSIADIARMLQVDQKPLYRRKELLLKDLRRQLAERGVGPAMVGDIFHGVGFALAAEQDSESGKGPLDVRQSLLEDGTPADAGRAE